jgi:hypothetical protein
MLEKMNVFVSLTPSTISAKSITDDDGVIPDIVTVARQRRQRRKAATPGSDGDPIRAGRNGRGDFDDILSEWLPLALT